MAQYLNDTLFGVNVPDKIIQTMDASDNRIQTSIDISSSIIESMKPMCSGVHIMAIGWESHIPKILQNTKSYKILSNNIKISNLAKSFHSRI